MDEGGHERRRWKRDKPVSATDVTICCFDPEKGLRTIQVRVADVSRGGLGIQSPEPLPVGSRLSTGGTLDQFPIDLYGRGARVASCRKTADGSYKIGLAFEEVPRLEARAERGIWHAAADGRTISLNASMCRMLEVADSEELIGKPYQSFLRATKGKPAGRGTDKASLGEAQLTGRLGSTRNVLIHEEPLFNADGVLKSFLRTFTDLDALRRSPNPEPTRRRA